MTKRELMTIFRLISGRNPRPQYEDDFSRLKDGNLFRFLPIIIVVGTIISLLMLSMYTVSGQNVGVVTRFGQHIRTDHPGLHFKIPLIDSVTHVPVEIQHKMTFGFATQGATNRWEYSSPEERKKEQRIITGDLNEIRAKWVIQYQIVDPEQYLFRVYNPEATLRDISENAMREVQGDNTIDEALTYGRAATQQRALELINEGAKEFGLGVHVTQLNLTDVLPPPSVVEDYTAVHQAQQEKQRMIDQAKREYNRVIPLAKGKADALISKAKGYAAEKVNRAKGDVAAFTAVYEEYTKAPDITRDRLRIEALESTYKKLDITIVDEDVSLLPLLNVGKKITPKLAAEEAEK